MTFPIIPDLHDGEDKSSPFGNCLRNNFRHLRKWAKRTLTDCFRLYDREIKEYPLAIDLYAGRFCIHYFSPGRDQLEPPDNLIVEIDLLLKKLFGVESSSIFWRTRSKSKLSRQYEKIRNSKNFFPAQEFGVKFLINLEDYLDTGLFLDHRETRKLFSTGVTGQKILNLFAYTCAFSVHAAKAGAAFTKSVDLSNTYTSWGRENFILNGLSLKNNPIIRSDCLQFLDEEFFISEKYDRIIIDPPTISRSKKMSYLFDIQIDYVPLIEKSLKLLTKGGMIFFSTNSRKFHFDNAHFPACTITEISHKTLPLDFKDPKIHRCWKITT
jgi:23S rRNA (cytosine1962-C5)-methyltransferase